ncbi:hypothetical protein [Kitasatospora acidiphila]|uniref:hypothetical protein n=1 Tax=Kitasatospora acidiphila TaxID=2567942 RepID=UPI003C73906B
MLLSISFGGSLVVSQDDLTPDPSSLRAGSLRAGSLRAGGFGSGGLGRCSPGRLDPGGFRSGSAGGLQRIDRRAVLAVGGCVRAPTADAARAVVDRSGTASPAGGCSPTAATYGVHDAVFNAALHHADRMRGASHLPNWLRRDGTLDVAYRVRSVPDLLDWFRGQ